MATTIAERRKALQEKRAEIHGRWSMYSRGEMDHLANDAWGELEEVDREIAALDAEERGSRALVVPIRPGVDTARTALTVSDETLAVIVAAAGGKEKVGAWIREAILYYREVERLEREDARLLVEHPAGVFREWTRREG